MQAAYQVPFMSHRINDAMEKLVSVISGTVERRYTLPCLMRPALTITNGLPEQGGGGGSDATGATAAPEASSDDDEGGDGDGDPDSDRRRSSKHPSPAVTPLKRGKHRTAAAMAGDPSPPPQENPRPFDALPDSAYLREAQLVQKPGNPTPLIPASASTLWRWVKAGTFPAPRKLSPKVTAWRVGDVRAWLQQQAV